MKIGMTLTPYMGSEETAQDAITELLWAVKYADENDFDIVWSTEHHFTRGSFSGSPSVLLTQYAAMTQRIQIGYAVAIVPLHHPMRLAEDMAWIDQLSKGRLIGGVSQGWAAYEFDVLGVDINERHTRYEEGYDILRKALTGGKFSHEGQYWKLNDVEIVPPAYQEGGPKFVIATTSEKGVETAAHMRGSPIMGFEGNERLNELRQLYIKTAREDGVEQAELNDMLSRVGALRRLIVCGTDEEAENEAIEAAGGFARSAQKLLANQKGTHVEGILRRRPDEDVDPRKSYAYTGTIWGSPKRVVEKLLELKELGLGHVVLQFHTNTRDREGTRENIRLFANEVLPAYRAALKARESEAA